MTLDYPLLLSTGTAIFAGVGLFLNWWAIRENNKTRQLQLINDSFNSIKETELELYKHFKNKDEKVKKEWDSLHFNSVERLAFLVNEKFIKDKKLVKFFDDAIVMWYEDMFKKNHSEEEIKDEKLYPEFKKLYQKIKEGSF